MTGAPPGGGAGRDAVRRVLLSSEATRVFPGGIQEKGTFLQRAGVTLFLYVLGFTVLLCVALFAYLLCKTPAMPSLSGAGTPIDTTYVRLVFEQRAQVFSNFNEAVSRLLLNLCLPLLTAILGYIFGQRS